MLFVRCLADALVLETIEPSSPPLSERGNRRLRTLFVMLTPPPVPNLVMFHDALTHVLCLSLGLLCCLHLIPRHRRCQLSLRQAS